MSQEPRIENVSDTALWVAVYRAQETLRPDALFKDPLAAVLAGERGRQIAETMAYSRIMAWIMVIRTVAIDRLVAKAVAEGADTVLNLGAGLDTRPYRMALPPGLRWIEVDFPSIVGLKNAKLASETPACRLERVALDLADLPRRRALFAELGAAAGHVLVITEGVIPYLTDEQAGALADDLARVPTFRRWIQDYRNGGFVKTLPRSWIKTLKDAPFRFAAEDWFGFFAAHGWRPREDIVAAHEAERVGRRVPFIFPLSLLFLAMPKAKREAMRLASGYVLLENQAH